MTNPISETMDTTIGAAPKLGINAPAAGLATATTAQPTAKVAAAFRRCVCSLPE
jgi:hypothetical protein